MLLVLFPLVLFFRSPRTALLRKRFIRPRHLYSQQLGLPPLQLVLQLFLQLSPLLQLLLVSVGSVEVYTREDCRSCGLLEVLQTVLQAISLVTLQQQLLQLQLC